MPDHIDSAAVLPAIASIYDAALNPAQWPGVVAAVAALHGTDKALLMTHRQLPGEGGIAFPVGIPQAAMHQWKTQYADQDVWVKASIERGLFREGAVVTDEDLYPHDDLLATVWYREFLSGIGVARMLSGVIFGPDSGNGRTAVISVFRDGAANPFGGRERALHSLLIPHLSRALGIMFRLRDSELKVASSLAALDRISGAILLLGGDGSVVFINRAAQSILARDDGLSLRRGGLGRATLSARSPDAERALTVAIRQSLNLGASATSHFSQAVRVDRHGEGSAYLVNLSALPPGNEFGVGHDQTAAIVFISDPDQPVCPDQTLLVQSYGLSPAECRLAAQLCAGETLSVIAQRLGIRESTVKTQLLSIFYKTGSRRRVQLVKLLLSLASTRQ